MDFASLKKKALELKNKSVELWKKAIDETAKKVWESSLVLKNNDEFLYLVEKSKNSTFENEQWELKVYTKRSYLIIWDSKKDFFKKMLISLPIFLTKTFSQNIYFKMLDSNNNLIDLSHYEILDYPCLLIFENNNLIKIIYKEENINKIVKSFSLDINKTVDEL